MRTHKPDVFSSAARSLSQVPYINDTQGSDSQAAELAVSISSANIRIRPIWASGRLCQPPHSVNQMERKSISSAKSMETSSRQTRASLQPVRAKRVISERPRTPVRDIGIIRLCISSHLTSDARWHACRQPYLFERFNRPIDPSPLLLEIRHYSFQLQHLLLWSVPQALRSHDDQV